MIRALVTGRLLADPQPRTASSGQSFALARLSVKQDDGWVSCSIIAFDKAAAAVLDVSPGTLSVWRSTGRYALPFLKIGRKVRYRRSDLQAWMDSRTRESGATA